MPTGIYKRKKGIKKSKEHKEKIRQSLMGHAVSDEARKKMSLARKGKRHSDETKKKIKKKLVGRKITWREKIGKGIIKYYDIKGRVYRENRCASKLRRWRAKILLRDNFTCQSCGKVSKSLDAHHIKAYLLFPELIYDVDNGIALCRQCHMKTDSWGRRGKSKYKKIIC